MKKTKLLGLATLLLSLGVVGCGGAEEANEWKSDKTNHWHEVDNEGTVEEVDKAKHTFEVSDEKSTAATCTEKGTKVEVCSVCGYEKSSAVKASGHTYVEQTAQSVTATCEAAGKKVEKCSVCGDIKETVVDKLDHNFVDATDADHTNVTATCNVEGYHWQKCSVCGKEWKKVEDGYADHSWGEYGAAVKAANNSAYKVRECSSCHAKDICVNAMDYTAIDGSVKSGGPENTLKLSSNGNSTTYVFSLDKAFTGKIYIVGQVDYWKDGSNNNDQRTFKSRKSGDGFNLEVTVNSTLVEITNEKTYEEMGMDTGETIGNVTYSTTALCELGNVSLVAGENTINYKRIESYNLNISEIHFIGSFAA